MMVVLFHLNAATHVYDLTRNAWVAVDFFFVLSGFVLMAGFAGRVDDGAAFGRFVARRLSRLYPLHLAALAVLFALVALAAWRGGQPLFAGSHDLSGLLQNMALVQGFTTRALSWNFPAWSISLELWASLLFGLVLWRARSGAWIVFSVIAVAFGAVVLFLGEPAGPAATKTGALLKAAHYLSAFAEGAVLFPLFAWVSRRGWTPPPGAEWATFGLAAAIFLFADRLVSEATVGLFALVIFMFAFEAGPVSAALRRPSFQAIGRLSYSTYLVHPLWTIVTFHLVRAAGLQMGLPAIAGGERLVLGGPFLMDVTAIACLAAVTTTAALTYRFIEKPGTRLACWRA